MADRYWVGGTGNWSDTARWSTGSGGSSGASVPTSADNVFFDNNSAAGTFTVTVDVLSNCANFDASGITNAARKMTLITNVASTYLYVTGSWINPTSTYFANTGSGTSGFILAATTTGQTITTNGVSFTCNILCGSGGAGVGGGWTLAGALTTSQGFFVRNGTFDTSSTGNYSITATTLTVDQNTPTINLNGSSLTLSSTTPVTISATGMTLNAGTSTITCSNASPTFAGGGKTFNNVTFSSTAGGTVTITGANTFNGTLSQASRSGTSFRIIQFSADQTIGTLTLGTANTAIRRLFCVSGTIGTQRTLTVTTFTATTDVDFRDIQAAGSSVSSSNWNSAGTGRFGDCGGNGNKITFDTAKTVYWNLAAGGNWSDTVWATTTGSGAAVAANNFPLAQDTAIIQSDTATLGAGNTITFDVNWNVGSVNLSSRTSNAMTLAFGTATLTGLYGDFNVGSGVTVTSTSGALLFAKQGGTQIFTYSPAAAFPKSITQNGPTGTVQIAGNTTLDTTFTYTLTAGTLDLTNNGAGNYTLSTGLFASNNSNTRVISFGTSGKMIATGNNGTPWGFNVITNFSYTGTSYVELNYSGSTGTRFVRHGSSGGATEANAVNFVFTGNATDEINWIGYARNFDLSGFGSGGVGTLTPGGMFYYGNLTFSANMATPTGAVTATFLATSGTQLLTTNGKTLDFLITQNNPGATLRLQDNLTMGSTRTFTLSRGTLDLNGKTASINTFSATFTDAKQIIFNSGTLLISGTSTSAFTSLGTNLTTSAGSGNGTISMTAATAKTFAGGDCIYAATLNQGGAGTLTITGSNTFYNITNSVQPTTVTFPAGINTYVYSFSLSGTAGNLVSINSSTPGTQFFLVKL